MMNERDTIAFAREERKLASDKNMGKIQMNEYHNQLINDLRSDMGQDMMDILTHKKEITPIKKKTFKDKFKDYLRNLLRL